MSRYREIGFRFGREPDVARLQESEAFREQIAEQKSFESAGNGHVFKEHRATTEELRQRAADGACARDGVQRHIPVSATGFRSDEAAIAAIAAAWNDNDSRNERIDLERQYRTARARGASPQELMDIADDAYVSHSGTAEDALGPDWRMHVEGYTRASAGRQASNFGDDTRIVTVFSMAEDGRWYAVTCFPKP